MKRTIPLVLFTWSLFCPLWGQNSENQNAGGPTPRHFAAISLTDPRSLTVDREGNLYVGDSSSGSVTKISPSGQTLPLGGVTASNIHDPLGLTVDRDGGVFVADAQGNGIYKIPANGKASPLGRTPGNSSINTPTGVSVDSKGSVFVANNGGNDILKITADGVVTIFAGKANSSGSQDGMGANARFNTPRGITIDGKDNLYVADEGNSNIRKITPEGVVTTLAGTVDKSGSVDGMGLAASFSAPRSLAADVNGTVYVADTDNNTIRKITPAGEVSTLAGRAGKTGKADGPGDAALFSEPRGIAVDALGNVYVADTGNSLIRQISPSGAVSTVAGAKVSEVIPSAALFTPEPAPSIAPKSGRNEKADFTHAQTLEDWEGNSTFWSVKDGIYRAKAEKAPSTFLLTKKHYSDFRLTLWSQVIESDNHAGVALWGDQVVAPDGKNLWAYRGPLVIFPGLGLWDYATNKGIPIDPVGKAIAKKIAGQHDWIHVEILAQGNRIRVAYNGQQVMDWREPDPSRLKDGPIGLQLHGYSRPQEVIYKDVVIESFPQDDRLITITQ